MRARKLEELIRKFEDEDQAYHLAEPVDVDRTATAPMTISPAIKEWSAAGGLGIEEW